MRDFKVICYQLGKAIRCFGRKVSGGRVAGDKEDRHAQEASGSHPTGETSVSQGWHPTPPIDYNALRKSLPRSGLLEPVKEALITTSARWVTSLGKADGQVTAPDMASVPCRWVPKPLAGIDGWKPKGG
jgi:hypothetical protein